MAWSQWHRKNFGDVMVKLTRRYLGASRSVCTPFVDVEHKFITVPQRNLGPKQRFDRADNAVHKAPAKVSMRRTTPDPDDVRERPSWHRNNEHRRHRALPLKYAMLRVA